MDLQVNRQDYKMVYKERVICISFYSRNSINSQRCYFTPRRNICTMHGQFREIVIILFSFEINFNQGIVTAALQNTSRQTVLHSISIIPCILFEKLNTQNRLDISDKPDQPCFGHRSQMNINSDKNITQCLQFGYQTIISSYIVIKQTIVFICIYN